MPGKWRSLLRDLFVNFSIVVTLTNFGVYLVILRPRQVSPWLRHLMVGLFLSGSSMLLMAFPIPLPLGVILDFRCVPILLASFYRGPRWGLAHGPPDRPAQRAGLRAGIA
jgi:hypothetical protein